MPQTIPRRPTVASVVSLHFLLPPRISSSKHFSALSRRLFWSARENSFCCVYEKVQASHKNRTISSHLAPSSVTISTYPQQAAISSSSAFTFLPSSAVIDLNPAALARSELASALYFFAPLSPSHFPLPPLSLSQHSRMTAASVGSSDTNSQRSTICSFNHRGIVL